ncbi:MAG: hypothetical protein RIT81_34765 [Deltaproteobacteria bacterium]
MGGAVTLGLAALLASAYDPVIDTALQPPSGLSLGVGVQRLQDDFGLFLRVATPRFLDDHFAVAVAGGVGWYPDLRALPASTTDQDFSAWSTYGHARVTAEASASIVPVGGRLYGRLGPSFLWLSPRLSTTRLAFGVYGAVGAELFTGDAHRTHPFSLFLEVGATAHAAAADVANRTGPIETVDPTVDRPIATGFAIAGGVRFYLWR